MARKRGGLAGLYDRNKGLIQGAAPVVAGMFGGPLAGAAVGAAMKGLDREGKSGIGLDLGKAAMGGVTGYAAGGMGKSLAGGIREKFIPALKSKLGRSAADAGASAMPIAPNVGSVNVPDISESVYTGARDVFSGNLSGAEPVSRLTGAKLPQSVSRGMEYLDSGTKRPSLLSRAAAFAEKNPNAIGQAAKLAMGAVGPDNDGRAMALRERQYEDEQEAAGRRASIVSDLLAGRGGAFNRMPPAQMNEGYGSMNSYLEATAPEGMENERQRRLAASRFAQTMRGGGAFGMPAR